MEDTIEPPPTPRKLRLRHSNINKTNTGSTKAQAKKDALGQRLRDLLVPLAQDWVEHFRPIELGSECLKIIDNVAGGFESIQPSTHSRSTRSSSVPGLSSHASRSSNLSEQVFQSRDGAVSRTGFNFDFEDDREGSPLVRPRSGQPSSALNGSLSQTSNPLSNEMLDNQVIPGNFAIHETAAKPFANYEIPSSSAKTCSTHPITLAQ